MLRLGHILGQEVLQKRGRGHAALSSGSGGKRRFRRQHSYIEAVGMQCHGGGGDHTRNSRSRGACAKAEDGVVGKPGYLGAAGSKALGSYSHQPQSLIGIEES